jgi:hypothetical protein
MPELISEDDALYALDIVKRICADVGPGLSSTPQERERAEIIKNELESHLGTGNVTIEDFDVAPDSALYGPLVSAILMILAVLLNIWTGYMDGTARLAIATVALVLAIFIPLLFLFEFVLNYEMVDRFYRQKRSVNVIGRLRKPGTSKVEKLLILSGHHDSAPENFWIRILGAGFYVLSTIYFLGFLGILVVSILQLIGAINSKPDIFHTGILGWILLVFPIIPSIFYVLFMNRGRKGGGTVPGAADNLSASALSVAMCRFLAKNPSLIPDDTEIRFISFGSEEVGLRGARRYLARHRDELRRLDARQLNIETVAHPEINILTSDLSGTLKNSPEMIKSVVEAAKRAGVPYKLLPASVGVANDSGPFAKAGFKALTILPLKMPQQIIAFYHQKRDTPDVLSIEPFINVLKLSLEWIRHNGE